MTPMPAHDEAEALTHVAERLRSRFPHVDPGTITEMVDHHHRSYDGRPIRAFVPLLVEHDALNQLHGVPQQHGANGEAAPARNGEDLSLDRP
jgi:hypothetical protein